jgi:hypothetical protein
MKTVLVGLAIVGLFSGSLALACDVEQQDASNDATLLISQGSPATVATTATKSDAKVIRKTASKANVKPGSVAIPVKTVSIQ